MPVPTLASRPACALLLLSLHGCGSTPADDVDATAGLPDIVRSDAEEADSAEDAVTDAAEVDISVSDVAEGVDVDAAEADVGDAALDAVLDVPIPDTEPDLPGPAPEDCTNGIDDDLDGDIDDRDLDCIDLRACEVPPALCETGDWSCHASDAGADCLNGDDDDGDGLADCLDPDCAADPACLPSPCIAGECDAGFVCDIWTGRCLDTPPDPVAGAMIGEPCAIEEDCQTSGHSRSEVLPTCNVGWEGGYCMGGCSLCGDTWRGDMLPRRECPRGAVCLPPDQFSAQGAGSCVQECTDDSDCRGGGESEDYYCRRSFWVAGETLEFENGYCAPRHCESRGCSGWVCGC